MDFSIIFTILAFLLIVSIIGFGYYLKEYINQKGKNKALSEDNKKLTEENEGIKHKYALEIEKIKANYQLDITKRKYQYEAKSKVYEQFFKILDEINKQHNDLIINEYSTVIIGFQHSYTQAILEGNQSAIPEVLKQFTENLIALNLKYQEGLFRLKQETHSIKLLAPETIINKIKELEFLFETLNKLTMQVMQTMVSQEYLENKQIIEPISIESQDIGNKMMKVKEELIILMKKELDEI